jgi:hypothetical protein
MQLGKPAYIKWHPFLFSYIAERVLGLPRSY